MLAECNGTGVCCKPRSWWSVVNKTTIGFKMNDFDIAVEYYDCIVTAELSVQMAHAYCESPNRKLRLCCKAMLKRIKDERVRKIFTCMSKHKHPIAWLDKLRKELDEACSNVD